MSRLRFIALAAAALWLAGCPGRDNPCDPESDTFINCPGDMICMPGEGELDPFCIDRFEASRPDATGFNPGFSSTNATSRGGVQPWSEVSLNEARDACRAAGKELCSPERWTLACNGLAGRGPISGCNVGSGEVSATGTSANCRSAAGARDIIGNLRELTANDRENAYGGSFASQAEGFIACQGVSSNTDGDDTIGFRCCSRGRNSCEGIAACLVGNVCVIPGGSDTGTCTLRCSNTSDCPDGYLCVGDSLNNECFPVCNPEQGAAACAAGFRCVSSDAADGRPCTENTDCELGRVCLTNAEGNQTCHQAFCAP